MARRNLQLVQDQQKQNSRRSTPLKVTEHDLKRFDPITDTQNQFWQKYKRKQALLLHGSAGTGKTFIALYKAMEDVMHRGGPYSKLIIVRSAVPSREIGHLPGDYGEKIDVYSIPYQNMMDELFADKEKPYDRLMEQKKIYFMCTSFVRGITLDNSIVVVDECQNMSDMEINSIMTRIGHNSKIIFCGDFRQTDLYKSNDKSGLKKFIQIAESMPSFDTVEFGPEDIVRSELVKEYILARVAWEDLHENT
jgi:phosphate starvation-inducible protein PhoH|tara:strand:- start:1648 stop:2397 length:750 start_codon:yes stop_codon:yes gene_type:complete